MPTLEIMLNEPTYTSLQEAARQRSQSLNLLVQDALAAFLQLPPESAYPANGDWAFDSTAVARRAKIHTEAEAWRALPHAVRQSYGQEYVAVHEGQVIDHDPDRLALYRRVYERLGDVAVLITPAAAPSPREFLMHSPRLERVS